MNPNAVVISAMKQPQNRAPVGLSVLLILMCYSLSLPIGRTRSLSNLSHNTSLGFTHFKSLHLNDLRTKMLILKLEQPSRLTKKAESHDPALFF